MLEGIGDVRGEAALLTQSQPIECGEVNLRRLDRESRKECDVAQSAEMQSWLRYEAVTAAFRSQ